MVRPEHTDSRNLPRPLRPGGERRGEEAAREGAKKRTSVHEEPPSDRVV